MRFSVISGISVIGMLASGVAFSMKFLLIFLSTPEKGCYLRHQNNVLTKVNGMCRKEGGFR
jgi:hypothetical protein